MAHLQPKGRHAVERAQAQAERVQALHKCCVSTEPQAHSQSATHSDELPEVGGDNSRTTGSESKHLGRAASVHVAQASEMTATRTATQANATLISPDATGKNGLLTLSMLMS